MAAGVKNALDDQALIPRPIEDRLATNPKNAQPLAQVGARQPHLWKVADARDGGFKAVELTLGGADAIAGDVSPDVEEIVSRRL